MREVKIGIRVGDVERAVAFYRGLGFAEIARIPGPAGTPVLAVLLRDQVHLIVDALVGLPYPDTDRERRIQAGPRGLGCVIGLEVEDLRSVYDYCVAEGAEITSTITDQPWGERTFTCVDPFGWEWKFAVQIEDRGGAEAAAKQWFG